MSDGIPEVVTKHRAAELLGLHVKTVERLIRTGELRASRVTNRWVVQRVDLLAFLEARANRPREAVAPLASGVPVPLRRGRGGAGGGMREAMRDAS